MDLATREVTRGGRPVELTRTEFTLLEMFLAHPRQVLTREQILKAVWGFDFEPSSNSLDVYVMYLRRKTEAGGEPRLVHTVRGVGYVLRTAAHRETVAVPALAAGAAGRGGGGGRGGGLGGGLLVHRPRAAVGQLDESLQGHRVPWSACWTRPCRQCSPNPVSTDGRRLRALPRAHADRLPRTAPGCVMRQHRDQGHHRDEDVAAALSGAGGRSTTASPTTASPGPRAAPRTSTRTPRS